MASKPPITLVHGGCHCGRNKYTVSLDDDNDTSSTSNASIISSDSTSRTGAVDTEGRLYLRVPLTQLRSTLFAYSHDETPSTIRRTYTHTASGSSARSRAQEEDDAHAQLSFCGYCGTSLTRWSEWPAEEADFISVNLGSIVDESLDRLFDTLSGGQSLLRSLALREDSDDTDVQVKSGLVAAELPAKRQADQRWDDYWVDSVMEDGLGGRVRTRRHARSRRRGGAGDGDGSMTVEWEVVEVLAGDAADDAMEGVSMSPGKRKSPGETVSSAARGTEQDSKRQREVE